jgi:hypothetical protein
MFSLFNGLSHLPHWLTEASDRQPPTRPLPTGSPGFLHAGFAMLEPGLTSEIRQALGAQALGAQTGRRAGDAP